MKVKVNTVLQWGWGKHVGEVVHRQDGTTECDSYKDHISDSEVDNIIT